MPAFIPETKENIERWDPISYLGSTFEDAHSLLYVMTYTGTIISGSRAVEYFVPGTIDDTADWDFFVEGNSASIEIMKAYLGFVGVEWSEPDGRPDGYNTMFSLIRGVLTRDSTSGKRTVPVQLIWISGKPAVRNVMRFHSSAVQCFLAGTCAVSLYHDMTTRKKSYHWTFNDRLLDGSNTSPSVAKYVSRGFEYVEHPSGETVECSRPYVVGFSDWLPYVAPEFEYYVNTFYCNFAWREVTMPSGGTHTYDVPSYQPPWITVMGAAFTIHLRHMIPDTVAAVMDSVSAREDVPEHVRARLPTSKMKFNATASPPAAGERAVLQKLYASATPQRAHSRLQAAMLEMSRAMGNLSPALDEC